MITGAHAILYSADADRDRAFLRDVLGLSGVDAGGGWLIFGLPPSEVAVHPAESSGHQELYFLCDDVEAFAASLGRRGVACSPIDEQRWGRITHVTLPGGGTIGVYEPRHPRPAAAQASPPAAPAPSKAPVKAAAKPAKPAKAPAKKPAKKPAAKPAKKAAAKKPAPKAGKRPAKKPGRRR
jgi:catechol 2,3-dioxygenase-like lactoylglutathione lyase family enzyme